MSASLRRLLALSAVVIMITATAAMAQTITGRISGTITETSGAALGGVTVERQCGLPWPMSFSR